VEKEETKKRFRARRSVFEYTAAAVSPALPPIGTHVAFNGTWSHPCRGARDRQDDAAHGSHESRDTTSTFRSGDNEYARTASSVLVVIYRRQNTLAFHTRRSTRFAATLSTM